MTEHPPRIPLINLDFIARWGIHCELLSTWILQQDGIWTANSL